MGWYRIKRVVGSAPVPEFYDKKVQELEQLKQKEHIGEIEIRYVDAHWLLFNSIYPLCLARN